MKIAVVGTGYVGLVTGCCLAESGHEVTCIDNNAEKIEALKRGESPIFELGLVELLQANSDRLSFVTDLKSGVQNADIIFLALPTPSGEDGSADLSAVKAVSAELGKYLPSRYCVVVNKSTVPVGTAETVHEVIAQNAKSEFDVVSNPEFLREGYAIKDFTHPERVVVGTNSKRAEKVMRELYAPFVSDSRPLYVTDTRTAELAKYAANTFLVTKISFMNEIAQLCERMDSDVDMVRQIIGADSRIGPKFLYPGIGSGGSCFPKDVRALKYMSEQNDYNFRLLRAAMEINDQQKQVLVDKLLDHFGGSLRGKTFALWGLAFKPGTDDIREAPALVILDELLKHGASVRAHDPKAASNVKAIFKGKNTAPRLVEDKYEALTGSDGLLIATEWPEYIEADLKEIARRLTSPVVLDGRNIFEPESMQKAGFTYYSIGRPSVKHS